MINIRFTIVYFTISSLVLSLISPYYLVHAQQNTSSANTTLGSEKVPDKVPEAERTTNFSISEKNPEVIDPNLKAELVVDGLKRSTNMEFLGPNDIVVLDKNRGTVQRIINGTIQEKPLLDVPVSYKMDRGMMGIAVSRNQTDASTYVFLFYTESATGTDQYAYDSALANRVYRYDFKDNKLTNPKLLLNITAETSDDSAMHNGGKILIGPDENLYVIVGDLHEHRTTSQNNQTGPPPDGTSVIYRITQDGKPADGNPFGRNVTNNKFYAYGIRESFGMDFDPLSKKLWDTENGADYGDEINLVNPGFNSGWKRQQGFIVDPFYPDNFVNLGGTGNEGRYSDPEFVWTLPVGPTALKFLTSDELGRQYRNDMFVGEVNTGSIYHFELNDERTKLILYTPLADRTANSMEELQQIIFGRFFGGITDIKEGPDHFLYVLNYGGQIWRIVPKIGSNIDG
jgi:glucose/arabinose dehydrogenase